MPEYSISQLNSFEECALQYRLMLAPDGAFEIHDYKTGSGLPEQAERVFAPHESALCDWCPYWDLCPVKKHLVKVEGLPGD